MNARRLVLLSALALAACSSTQSAGPLEAPKGAHEWLTRATFVATLELEAPAKEASADAPPKVEAVRIRFYQVK